MTCRVARVYRPPHQVAPPVLPAAGPDRAPSEPSDPKSLTPLPATSVAERSVEAVPGA
jgi:hypothetical protein